MMTRTIVWLLLVIHNLNEINSATGHFSAVKTPRFKRGISGAGADSPAEDYGSSFYGPDSPPTLLYDNQQLPPQFQEPTVNLTNDRPALTVNSSGHQNSQPTTIGHQLQSQVQPIQEPTVNFTIGHPTLTDGHQPSQPITIGQELQRQVQHHEPVFGHQTLGHEHSQFGHQAGSSAIGNQIHPQHWMPYQFQAETVTEGNTKGAKAAIERRRRERINAAMHNLDQLIGKRLSNHKNYLAACDLINELCLKLRLWKSRDAQMQEEQKCFHENLQIIYDELAKHPIDKKLWPTFNQSPLPALISSDVDMYMSTARVDFDRIREMPEAADDDDDDDDINEPMATQNQQTAHKIAERRRRLDENTALDVLYEMVPLKQMFGRKTKFVKITAATNYIQKLKSLQKEHENAELSYAKWSGDFAQHMNVLRGFFQIIGVPMPALSDCDRKGKRVKIGHEHRSSPRKSSSSSGNSGGKGVQPQMMGALSADDHFLHATMASGSHHPQGLMPFGEANSSQHHQQPLHQQHETVIPMQGMHGYPWPDSASNYSGDDDMDLLDDATLFDMVRRSAPENSPVDVEQLKKAVQGHKMPRSDDAQK